MSREQEFGPSEIVNIYVYVRVLESLTLTKKFENF